MAAIQSQSGLLNWAPTRWIKLNPIAPKIFLLACGFLLCASFPACSQSPAVGGVNQGGAPYLHSPAGLNPMPEKSEGASQIDQMRAAERQKRIAADTAKLVQLTNELKAQLDQAPSNQISMDLVKKSAEIEKLAHDLNSWLKQ
jgi:hypothetical protein